MKIYKLTITTPEKSVFDGPVISLSAPGTLGYLEILAHHAPIITTLKQGKLTLTTEDKHKITYTISSGILDVLQNEAILLADTIESGGGGDFAPTPPQKGQ